MIGNLTSMQANRILWAVNAKRPKESFKNMTKDEEEFYDETWRDAIEDEKKYGCWPTFENIEIDWEEPCLDIYNTPADRREWNK